VHQKCTIGNIRYLDAVDVVKGFYDLLIVGFAVSVDRYVANEKVLSDTNDIDTLDVAAGLSDRGRYLTEFSWFVLDLNAERETIARVGRGHTCHVKKYEQKVRLKQIAKCQSAIAGMGNLQKKISVEVRFPGIFNFGTWIALGLCGRISLTASRGEVKGANMDILVLTYVCYVLLSVVLTVWVAQTLHKNGRVFLIEVFRGDESLADSVNHLLVVGFYLINFGYVSLALKLGYEISSVRESIEALSWKVGLVLLVLGTMHFFNLLIFSRIHRRPRDLNQVPKAASVVQG